MSLFTEWIKQIIREQRLRKRFPGSVIHSGAIADDDSFLEQYSVLFRNVVLIDSTLGAYSYVQKNSSIFSAEVWAFLLHS